MMLIRFIQRKNLGKERRKSKYIPISYGLRKIQIFLCANSAIEADEVIRQIESMKDTVELVRVHTVSKIKSDCSR